MTNNYEEMIEKFAAIEHERWAKWQKYMHSKFVEHSNGNGEFVCLPVELFRRWTRQMETPYSELSEEEKESDREQVKPYLDYLSQAEAIGFKKGKEMERDRILPILQAVSPYLSLSSDVTSSDLLYRTPAQSLRESANALDKKDEAIRLFNGYLDEITK